MCFQVKSPSAGRLLPGLRAPFIFTPQFRATFTAGGIFKNKKKTGKPKPRLLCWCDKCKFITLDFAYEPFPSCLMDHLTRVHPKWAGAAISRWASSHPGVGVVSCADDSFSAGISLYSLYTPIVTFRKGALLFVSTCLKEASTKPGMPHCNKSGQIWNWAPNSREM